MRLLMIICNRVHGNYYPGYLPVQMGAPQGKGKVQEIVSYLDIDAKEISGDSKLRLNAPPDILQSPLIQCLCLYTYLPTAT